MSANQCDGCKQGNPADAEGYHRDLRTGFPFMMCEASTYKPTFLRLGQLGVSQRPQGEVYLLESEVQSYLRGDR